MKIVSYQKIADSLGISKQAVDKLYVRKGYLRKNEKGRIDLDNPHNRQFLEEKGANFRFFGEVQTKKSKQKSKKMPEKPEKTPVKEPEIETNGRNDIFLLDKQLKIEQIKLRRKDSEYKTLKIMEMQSELIPRKIVDQLIEDFFGRFNEMLLNKPKSLVSDIIAEAKEGTQQTIIRLLQKAYMDENKKLLQNAMKRYIDAIDQKIKDLKDAKPTI